MDDLIERIEKLEQFDARAELSIIVSDNGDTIADLQRDQMMEGRGVDGEYIRPYYSENPYFKTPEAAKRYAKWKAKITPNPQRPEDVPNLYINGYFQGLIKMRMNGEDEFELDSDAEFGDRVFDVHKNARGLNEEKRLLFAETITLPEFSKVLQEKAGLIL